MALLLISSASFGWLWIFLGVVSGMLLGLGFLHPTFLGGYASPRRRLLRLGHISFIGLGALNVLYQLTVASFDLSFGFNHAQRIIEASLVISAITMPLICALVAWKRAFHPLFAVPVLSALLGTGLLAWEMLT